MSPIDRGETTSPSDPRQTPASPEADAYATILTGSEATACPKVSPAANDEVAYWIGRRLARYQIVKLLGAGGMGLVYLAHDTLIERDVAIKVLLRSLSSDENILKRFLIEAKAAGRLNHPNAVAIYEIGQEQDCNYLVMELMPGGSVGDQLATDGAFSVLEATRILAEACKGLAAAHGVGLIHRDVKPANLLFTADRAIKISDFGLAKTSVASAEQVTHTGQVFGTPYFMSPEQCQGVALDHRSDLYSLGATYYSLLTGAHPFSEAGSVMQIMFSHCQAGRPDPRAVKKLVPDACAAIVRRAMAIRPEDRYQSAAEMLSDLTAALATLSGAEIVLPSLSKLSTVGPVSPSPPASSRRRFLYAGAGLAALILAAIGAGLIWNSGKPPEKLSAAALPNDKAQGAGAPARGAPLRVGILHSLSGTLAFSESPVVDATLLAIEEINTAGGVLGRPVEPVVRDGRSEAPVFAAEAGRLIAQEKVCTVFGCWTSASRKTVVPIFEEHDHLLIYPVQYEGLEESPNVIYMGAAPNQQIIPAVKWAFAFNGKRKFYLVGSDYVFPRTANAIIKDTLVELGGTVAGEEYIPLGESEVQPLVAKIVLAAPDVILNTLNGDSNLSFFKELRRAGITPETVPTISFSIGEVELRNLDLSQMAGDFAAWNYFQSLENGENLAFVERFQARYGAQRVVNDPMEAAYVGVKLWAAAVKQAQSDNPADIRRAMHNQRMAAPEGEIRIDPATQHAVKTPRIGKISADGQFEVVWAAAKPEPARPYPPSRKAEEWKAFLHDLYRGWGDSWAAPAR